MKNVEFRFYRILIRTALLVLLVVLSLCSCDFAPDASPLPESKISQTAGESITSDSVQVIDATTALEMMNDGEAYILVDVRTEDEFSQGHIEGAVLVPYDQIDSLAPTLIPDMSSRILVYCRSGRRSAIAAESLVDMGYNNVYDFGGINDWPYGVVS